MSRVTLMCLAGFSTALVLAALGGCSSDDASGAQPDDSQEERTTPVADTSGHTNDAGTKKGGRKSETGTPNDDSSTAPDGGGLPDGGSTVADSPYSITVDGVPVPNGAEIHAVFGNKPLLTLMFFIPPLEGEERFEINATAAGQGCDTNTFGKVNYSTASGSFGSTSTASCGLSLTAWTETRMTGSFDGFLSNYRSGATKHVVATFDVKAPNAL